MKLRNACCLAACVIPLVAMVMAGLRDPFAVFDGLNWTLSSEFDTRAYLDVDEQFPLAGKILKPAWRTIRAETERLLERYQLPEFSDIEPHESELYSSDDSSWEVLWLIALHERVLANEKLMPETAKLLQQIPGIRNAFISVLHPGMVIDPHVGPQASIIRYHLGLIVPEPDKAFINFYWPDGKYYWQEGEHMIFNDFRVHEARNEGTQNRAVLIIDIQRRHLTPWKLQLDNWLIAAMTYFPQFDTFLHEAEPKLKQGTSAL